MVFKTRSAPVRHVFWPSAPSSSGRTTAECSRPREYPLCLPQVLAVLWTLSLLVENSTVNIKKKKKKGKTWELWDKLYLGSNEDSSPGNSLSGRSEALSEEGGNRSVQMWLYLRGRRDMQHTLWWKAVASHKKVAPTHEEQISLLMILVLF